MRHISSTTQQYYAFPQQQFLHHFPQHQQGVLNRNIFVTPGGNRTQGMLYDENEGWMCGENVVGDNMAQDQFNLQYNTPVQGISSQGVQNFLPQVQQPEQLQVL